MKRVNQYPSLCGSGRYFRTVKELADAGCMGRTRAFECLSGVKQFTENEKRAISNAIAIKEHGIKVTDDFDGRFRRKAGTK